MCFIRLKQSIRAADPRLKALLALWTGIMVWRASLSGVCVYLAGMLVMAGWLADGAGSMGLRLRLLLFPIAFWMGLNIVLESLTQAPLWPEGILKTALLGARLLTLLLLGLVLTLSSSRTQLGRAANCFLRPVLGRSKSWQGALALSLMIHFIPLTLTTLGQVRQSIALRAEQLPFPKRVFLWVTTTLRVLSTKTWTQTLALAARRLDHAEAWQDSIPFRPEEWASGLLAAGLVFSLSLI